MTIAEMLSVQELGLCCHVECAPERAVGVQDPLEYYDPPGGLLAYQPQLGNLVNESVITGDGMELEDYRGHFNLVNAQLTQVCPGLSFLPRKPCQYFFIRSILCSQVCLLLAVISACWLP